MNKIIKETENWVVYHHQGYTTFRGCQCVSDCNCYEKFVPSYYDYFTVKKKFGKVKTTNHSTLEEVDQRIRLLEDVLVNKVN